MVSFTEAELESIQAAVHAAEEKTSGEIVPYVAIRSAAYSVALWRAGVVFGLAAMLIMLAASGLGMGWSSGWFEEPAGVAVGTILAALLGVLSTYSLPALRRAMAGRGTLELAVHRRALQAFLDEEVFDTRDRTGILLFVSLFERRIEVLGDAGINAKVSPDEWGDVVHLMRDGVISGALASGLTAGIERCGALLAEKGVAIRDDDTNELPDGLRMDAG
jgi:putative membrane protein